MARALQDIITELNSVYQPQRDSYQQQITSLDPQLEAEQAGLQAQKQDSFQQITDQANRRGLFYSGLPVAEEQKYVGQQFLPAIANLRAKYSAQKFGLQDAIAKITADQYNQAYNVRQGELDLDLKRQLANEEAARQMAVARAAGGGGGGGGYSFGGGGGGYAAPAAAPANKNNPGGDAGQIFSLIQSLRQAPGGKQAWGWANLAAEFNRRGINTAKGSAADIALNRYFNAGAF